MTSSPTSPMPRWRFWLPLLAQLTLILGLPAQAMLTYLTGTTVILQTAPVDPYDLLRGYSQTLNYNISLVDTLDDLPGWEAVEERSSRESTDQTQASIPVYVVLEQPDADPTAEIPLAWQPVAIAPDLPRNLPDTQVVITGQLYYQQVTYGLERYYMPEDQRDTINTEIMELNQEFGNEPPFVVEVRVRGNGYAVPISLWVGDRQYQF
ncbi:GDYXXLXY domain-containing protein [Leptolyngbya sp. CCY15150]|uniref:GDYXXLXY domain-containing protein n=1 Tax=Leptolyngbya sp. CCY15150 TaxID=2767772 RepID=UPI001EF28CA4|nr:GDYXXLXY domain-containing protein [Leptolyngbya sp. CCY15150]